MYLQISDISYKYLSIPLQIYRKYEHLFTLYYNSKQEEVKRMNNPAIEQRGIRCQNPEEFLNSDFCILLKNIAKTQRKIQMILRDMQSNCFRYRNLTVSATWISGHQLQAVWIYQAIVDQLCLGDKSMRKNT